MRTVAELIAAKKDAVVHTVPLGMTVYAAMDLMAAKQIGALVIVDENGSMVGIVTERDYARKVALKDRTSRLTTVRTIMSAPVIHVAPQDSTDRCLVLMAHNQLRHLPVLRDEELVGMVSIRDLVDEIVADRRVLIDDLEHAVEERRAHPAEPPVPTRA